MSDNDILNNDLRLQIQMTQAQADRMRKTFSEGWECPRCGRVYSPFVMMCLYCGGNKKRRMDDDN